MANAKILWKLALAGMLVWTMPSGAKATDQSFESQVGLFEGQILLDNGIEPIVLRFDTTHGMNLISQLEITERESPGIGLWSRAQGSKLKFGFLSYREGSTWLCTGFDASAPPAACTLVVTGTYTIHPQTHVLTGSVKLTVKDRTDGGDNYTVGQWPIEAERRSIADLDALHQ